MKIDDRVPSMKHNCFENQDVMQFPCAGNYGIPKMQPTDITGDKMIRFMDWKEIDDPENYIAHFYYDDYKFISAWRNPNKYIERLRKFKAVVSPDFSLYTDFPKALQILSHYRRQWCGAYWQYLGMSLTVDGYEEIKEKSALDKAKKAGLKDPVRVGRAIMERKVAETAIEQGKQQRENYKSNMKKNVKGYDEVKKAISTQEIEYTKQRKSIEKGEQIHSAKKVDVAGLKKKYPRAAAYIEAESYSNSSNYKKSSLGEEAMRSIRMGGSHTKAISNMKEEWKKYLNKKSESF